MPTTDQHHRIDYLEFNVASIAASATSMATHSAGRSGLRPRLPEFRDGRLTGFAHGAAQPGGALVVLYSTALEDSLAQVEQAGGRITKPIFAFPGGRRSIRPAATKLA